MSEKIKVGIVGGAGYTSGELLRILINHPAVSIDLINSKSNAGKPIGSVHQDLFYSELYFTDSEAWSECEVLFLTTGHGEAVKFMEKNELPERLKVIDLSHDFRLAEKSKSGNKQFIYGLPEMNRDKIKEAQYIANPGCFATAIQLGLLPLASHNLLNDVYTTGITGSTGAGQSLSPTGHFSWRANNIQAYKTLTHQHVGEIGESLSALQNGNKPAIHFVPWRGDFTRGIFISSQVNCSVSLDELTAMYVDFYKEHPFTYLSQNDIHLKQVVNTNYANIQLEKNGDQLVIHSIIDNLVKGASGQAIQNMNLIFGLEETLGLNLKANLF
ncbi:MAG: N-acetyl-gamma-glutamyl-phosphate reductase [Saprospiraceae bacterium]|nr:N-acetyl-gamma-glutamyl-phosphate reductase [Saprospiraceae bacterium]